MTQTNGLPDGLALVRTTPVFDRDTVPDGLLRAHRIAAGVWGRLIVVEGTVGFRFEDEEAERQVAAGESIVIPPDRLHHVVLDGPARFCVEFHRA